MTFDTDSFDGMIYAGNWQRQKIAGSRSGLPESCLFVVPKVQQHTLTVAADLARGRPILELEAPDTNNEVVSFLKQSPDAQVIFLSNTKWQDGVDDRAAGAFLGLIKALTVFRSIHLDIVTTNAVPCPAFT